MPRLTIQREQYHYHCHIKRNIHLITTPTPRELYVEHLISQNRNTVSDIRYGTSIPSLTSVTSGGTMSLMVGQTYYIQLVGATATQGYEQIELFITIPNTIFQILSVDTTYSAESLERCHHRTTNCMAMPVHGERSQQSKLSRL